jgi:hypothetical protein
MTNSLEDAFEYPDFNPWLVPAYGQFMADVFAEFWWSGRQLTTGHHRLCPARYSSTEECVGPDDEFCADTVDCTCRPMDGGQLLQWWTDPHCPLHGEPLNPRPVAAYGRPPACCCLYGLRRVWGVTGMFELDPFREGWHRGVYAFKIHPRCPHHGDKAYVFAGTKVDCAWLDDQERRGD